MKLLRANVSSIYSVKRRQCYHIYSSTDDRKSICFPNNRLTNILNYLPTLSGAQKEKILEPLRLPRTLKIVY